MFVTELFVFLEAINKQINSLHPLRSLQFIKHFSLTPTHLILQAQATNRLLILIVEAREWRERNQAVCPRSQSGSTYSLIGTPSPLWKACLIPLLPVIPSHEIDTHTQPPPPPRDLGILRTPSNLSIHLPERRSFTNYAAVCSMCLIDTWLWNWLSFRL